MDLVDDSVDSSSLVWIGRIQIRSIDEPDQPPRLHPGGTVRVYVLAYSSDAAMMEIVEEVTNEEYELLELEWLDPVTPTGWPHSWDDDDARYYELAIQSQRVVLGEIHRWDPEEFATSIRGPENDS